MTSTVAELPFRPVTVRRKVRSPLTAGASNLATAVFGFFTSTVVPPVCTHLYVAMSPDVPALSNVTVWSGIAVLGLALEAAVTPADWRSAPTSRTGSVAEPPAEDLTTTFNGGEGTTTDNVPSASNAPPGTAVRVTPEATLLCALTVRVFVPRS